MLQPGPTPCELVDRLASLAPTSVLQVGGDPRWLVADLVTNERVTLGVDVRLDAVKLARSMHRSVAFAHLTSVAMQLDRRFDLVIVGRLDNGPAGHQRAVVHSCVQHCAPGGHVAFVHSAGNSTDSSHSNNHAAHATVHEFGLTQIAPRVVSNDSVSIYRRSERFTVHDLLFEARSTIERVSACTLHERLGSNDPPVVIDTRTQTDRARFGVIESSIHVPRTVVEWHLDPANGYLHPAIRSFDQPLVVVCNGGYSSSLAAANLVRLGYTAVADLIGGHHAWCEAALPVERADHSHLDF